MNARSGIRLSVAAVLMSSLTVFFTPIGVFSQTTITAPKNRYSVMDDVRLGQNAARQIRQQMQIVNDTELNEYLESVGRRLVAAIPPEFQHPEFHFTFQLVNAREINAFALPGGPTFVNTGMINAAHNEGELAGVMAHELSHVALRHATAQATEAQKYQIGSAIGQITGAIIGGGMGTVIGVGSQAGANLTTLKYSRKYESQADLLGSHIMARAGYDPHDLAKVFKTIEAQGGNRSPEFLSDHPNPGNRFEKINKEADLLNVDKSKVTQDTDGFRDSKARLGGVQTAQRTSNGVRRRSTSDDGTISNDGSSTSRDRGTTSRDRGASSNDDDPSSNTGSTRSNRDGTTFPGTTSVSYPSQNYRVYNAGDLYRVEIPDNWRQTGGGSSLTYTPAGAAGNLQGQDVFTRGVMIGVTNTQDGTLRDATDKFINALVESNSYLKNGTTYQRSLIDGNMAMEMRLSGVSPVTRRTEIVEIYTTQLRDGNLFYVINVAPQDEYSNYQGAFQHVLRSLKLTDAPTIRSGLLPSQDPNSIVPERTTAENQNL